VGIVYLQRGENKEASVRKAFQQFVLIRTRSPYIARVVKKQALLFDSLPNLLPIHEHRDV